MRLDRYLAEVAGIESRSRAKSLILLNRVTVNGRIRSKPSFEVAPSDVVVAESDYGASLGSIKLSSALDAFGADVSGLVCADFGASRGGFADVLLTRGAKRVYAVDVGECALPSRISLDPRVVDMSRTNARGLTASSFPEPIDFISCDLSFISLKAIFPALRATLRAGGRVAALIKPQFEVGRSKLPKSGIVRNASDISSALREIASCATRFGFKPNGFSEIPKSFKNRNRETFIYLIKL